MPYTTEIHAADGTVATVRLNATGAFLQRFHLFLVPEPHLERFAYFRVEARNFNWTRNTVFYAKVLIHGTHTQRKLRNAMNTLSHGIVCAIDGRVLSSLTVTHLGEN